MDKPVFARLRETPVICLILVILVSCNQLSSRETSLPPPFITNLTPTQRSTYTPTPRTVSITPVVTRELNIIETTITIPPTPTKSPSLRPTTRSPDVDLKDLPTSDLLFLSNGSLVRWDSENGMLKHIIQAQQHDNDSEPVIDKAVPSGSILRYSVDRRFMNIALLRSKGISANGVELFDLALLDVDDAEVIILIEEIPRIYQVSISPDGRWIAYSLNETSGQIYAQRTSGVGEPVEIGHYEVEEEWEYGPISWSPDSRSIVWSDASGLWVSNPDDPKPQQIMSDILEIKDFQGENSNIRVMYTILNWSPVGRYILATVKPYQSTVKWQGIIDTRRGHISEVPGSYEFQNPAVKAKWDLNGDLFIANINNVEDNQPPSLQIFRVVPTRDDMIVPLEEFSFRLEDFAEATGKVVFQNYMYLDLPTQVSKWEQSFILKKTAIGSPPTLFKFDKKSSTLTAISEIPFDTYSIDWSPDGESAILLGQHGSVLVVIAETRQVIDIGAAWELDSCCVNWLPINNGGLWNDPRQIIEN